MFSENSKIRFLKSIGLIVKESAIHNQYKKE